MTRQDAISVVAGALLAAVATGTAAADDGLPYVTVNLNNFNAVAIHDRALALMRTDTVFDADGNIVSSDTDVWGFDDLRLRQLTRDGGSGKLTTTVKRSDRYVGWAEFRETGPDIMGYDLERGRVIDVSDSSSFEDTTFDLRDDHFAWTVTGADFTKDFVLSDGRRNKVINEPVKSVYDQLSSDAQTSQGNAAFSALGTDRQDGSTDFEIFYYDGATSRLRQVTDDRSLDRSGSGYHDELPVISGDRVVFRTTHPTDAEPYRLRVYDAGDNRIRTLVRAGDRIVGGRRIADGYCFPLQLEGDLLVWNGSLEGNGPALLVTNVNTGRTVWLDEVTGGSVSAASTEGGYVAMLVADAVSTRVVVYQPATGTLRTLARYGAGFATSGVIHNSGPDVAYAYFIGDQSKVAVHYRLDSYARELLGR